MPSSNQPLGLSDRAYMLLIYVILLAGFSYMVWVELGVRLAIPFQVDDLYFLTCVARAISATELPIAGCHDNKGPIIYVAYQAVIDRSAPYSMLPIKGLAVALSVVLVAACGLLAGTARNVRSAFFASGFVLLLFINSPTFMALKTELVGLLFLLPALGLLWHSANTSNRYSALFAGFLFCFSVLSNQKFLFAALAFGVLAVSVSADWRPKLRQNAGQALLFAIIGGCLALAAIAIWFTLFGRLYEFLLGVFFYPTIYGGKPDAESLITRLAWRIGMVATALKPMALFVALAGVGLTRSLVLWKPSAAPDKRLPLEVPIALAALGYLAIVLASPVLFQYHFFPVLILASILVGITFDRVMVGAGDEPQKRRSGVWPVATVLVTVFSAAYWYGPDAKVGPGKEYFAYEPVNSQPGQYAYVVGAWPAFFVFNGLLPASEVMYPNALPEARASWAYMPPAIDSLKGRLLRQVQQRNDERLTADFRKTPPSFVFVEDAAGRRPGSAEASDFAGINTYIAAHCVLDRTVSDNPLHIGVLYACAVP